MDSTYTQEVELQALVPAANLEKLKEELTEATSGRGEVWGL